MDKWVGLPDSGLEDYEGFIYLITEKDTGKKYIGRKTLWFKQTKKPLKGKKRKRVSYIKSDYETYFGSCKELKESIEKKGHSNYRREVLKMCKSKSELSWYEAKYQILNDVLGIENTENKNLWYNANVKIRLIQSR